MSVMFHAVDRVVKGVSSQLRTGSSYQEAVLSVSEWRNIDQQLRLLMGAQEASQFFKTLFSSCEAYTKCFGGEKYEDDPAYGGDS